MAISLKVDHHGATATAVEDSFELTTGPATITDFDLNISARRIRVASLSPRIGRITGKSNQPGFFAEAKYIHELELPTVLHNVDGEITIRGHRIRLHVFADEYLKEKTIDQLRECFPTLGVMEIHELCKFCESHFDAVKEHADTQKRLAAMLSHDSPQALSLDQLRLRRTQN